MSTRNLNPSRTILANSIMALTCALIVSPAWADVKKVSEEIYYPDQVVLMEIYQSMHNSGDIEPRLYIENPSESLLKSTYDLAKASGRLEEDGFSLSPVQTVEQKPLGAELFLDTTPQAKAYSQACFSKALECAGESTGLALTCLATLIPGAGLLEVGGCLAAISAVGGAGGIQACKDVAKASVCSNISQFTPPVVSAGFKGSSASHLKKETLTCGGIHRVKSVSAKYKDWSAASTVDWAITALQLTCTSGTALEFVKNTTNAFPTNYWSGLSCVKGSMVQGIHGRIGSYLDGVGRICDRVVYGSDVADTTSSLAGDQDGGTPFSLKCSEHKYVYGAHVWYDATLPLEKRFISGIEVLCR